MRPRVHPDEPADLDAQLGLLLGLAPRALLRRLPHLEKSARVGPSALRRLDVATSQVHASRGNRQRADHDPRVAPGDMALGAYQARAVILLENALLDRPAACRTESRGFAQRQWECIGDIALRH